LEACLLLRRVQRYHINANSSAVVGTACVLAKQQINFFFSSSAVAVSRGGIPTDNAAMEAINGWVKAELFTDFHVTDNNKIKQEIAEYITFFYEQRPAYPLSYLTPKQFRESYSMNIAV
jgi:hypothetical protein